MPKSNRQCKEIFVAAAPIRVSKVPSNAPLKTLNRNVMNRRNFIRISGLSGGGLLMSTLLPVNKIMAATANGAWEPNLHLRITADNVVTLISTQYEIGQGTTTGMAQILVDELGANWDEIQIEQASGNAKKYGMWAGTGGSSGLAMNWGPVRKAGAAVREVLIQAAATQWNTSVSNCKTENSHVVNISNGEKLTFGELSTAASSLPLPENPTLKPISELNIVGKPVPGPKQRKIVTGTNNFSLDIKLPNMVYASIERVPVFGGKVQSVDDTEARKTPGIIDIYAYEGNAQSVENGYWGGVRAGVVVVGASTWATIQARKKLKIQWDLGDNATRNSTDIPTELIAKSKEDRARNTEIGDPAAHFSADDETPRFNYFTTYQSNACMEPLNAVADVTAGKAEVWVGTQAPSIEQVRLAKVLSLPEEKVTVNARPAGGGFGRRYFSDYTEEAVLISKRIGRPVKMMWTREDTIRTNRYHDQFLESWSGKLDENKRIVAAEYKGHLVRPNAYRALTYRLPNFGLTAIRPTKRLHGHVSWRSVGAHHWMLGLECFMDEMAHEAGVDPVEFRLNHLYDEDIVQQKNEYTLEDLYPARLKDCIRLAAEKAGWGKRTRRNTGLGIAAGSYNSSYCAIVAEVTVKGSEYTIDKMTAAVDCGLAINPSQVKAQIDGGMVWGISALNTEITIKNGQTEQSNFNDYQMPRMADMPEFETHIVKSNYAPTGTGEPSVPITAPAVLNAIFAASGKRVRRIPIDLSD